MKPNTVDIALLAQCFAALQAAEDALKSQPGRTWSTVMQARIRLELALAVLQPVPVEGVAA